MAAALPEVTNAGPQDVPRAVECIAAAFANDPLMAFFFPGDAVEREHACRLFFSLLLRVRLALGMPALVLSAGSGVVGLAMGYDATRPEWPADLQAEWDTFVDGHPGLTERFDAYDTISQAGTPSEPHFYLGVLGVTPQGQGAGAGDRLLRAFCSASEADPLSSGVYLETARPENVAFYLKRGFVIRAEGELDPCRLWCMYRQHAERAASDV